ncbi:MAG: hypothetical protein LH618_17575, partial [Saprospiraceae bacterium]|nr:hypothetical protein [Saprospiraceae bacterium]
LSENCGNQGRIHGKRIEVCKPEIGYSKIRSCDRKAYDQYMEAQRSDASFVETVKLEITSAVNDALKSKGEEIAKNALQKGATIEFTAEITGLSIPEIKELAARLGLDK